MKSRSTIFGLGGVVLVGSWLYHHSYARHGLALFDLGILFDGTLRTLHGEQFGVDFLAPYGPLRYWALAAVFSITGAKLWVWAESAAIVLAITGALLAMECARCVRWPVALLAALGLALAHGSLHKVDVLAAQVLSIWAMRSAVDGGARRSIAAGAMLGGVFLLRYDVGVFAAFATLVALGFSSERLPADRLRGCVLTSLAGLAVIGLVLVHQLGAGFSISQWWHDTWLRIGVQERIRIEFPWPLQNGRFGLRGDGWLLGALLLCPALVVTAGAGVMWRRIRSRPEPRDGLRLGSVLLALGVLNQARLVPTANHLFQAFPAVLFVVADLWGRPGRSWWGTLAFGGCVAALFVWIDGRDFGTYPNTHRSVHATDHFWGDPRVGMWLDDREFLALHSTVEEIQRRVPPGQRLGFGPSCALLCFLADRDPAHGFAEPSYYYRDEQNQQRLIDDLESSRAPVFVHRDRPTATLDFAAEAPRIVESLQRSYRLAAKRGDFLIFERIR